MANNDSMLASEVLFLALGVIHSHSVSLSVGTYVTQFFGSKDKVLTIFSRFLSYSDDRTHSELFLNWLDKSEIVESIDPIQCAISLGKLVPTDSARRSRL